MIVYHGTSQRAARRIRMEGFLPRPPSSRVWFAQSRSYAMQRARTKGRRAHDRAVVLTCDIDVPQLRQQLGSTRVMHRGSIIAVSGPVPASVLRSHGWLGVASTPEELVHWVNGILGVKPHKGVGRSHPGIQRLSRWVNNRLSVNPAGRVNEQELLAVAQQFLQEFFEGKEVDFKRLRVLPKAMMPAEEEPEPVAWEEEKEDTREMEALDCLISEKAKRRMRGLALLAELKDPDLFDWCAMFLEDSSLQVRVQALKAMRFCEEIEAEFVEPFADSEEKRIRAAAIQVLVLCGGEDGPKWYWRGVTDPDPHVRLATVHHLDKLEPSEHKEIFEAALYDSHPEIAKAARKLTAGKGFSKAAW